MNPQLLLGIIIGMGAVLFCFGVFLALPARRMSKSGLSFNERSLAELVERNAIGEKQLKILSAIDESLVIATNRKARRERIATAAMQGYLTEGRIRKEVLEGNKEVSHIGISVDYYSVVAICCCRIADALIAELDKPEP